MKSEEVKAKIEEIESAHEFHLGKMSVETLETLSDLYGRLVWLEERHEGFGHRQSIIEQFIKMRKAKP